jgi:hypothetical protein
MGDTDTNSSLFFGGFYYGCKKSFPFPPGQSGKTEKYPDSIRVVSPTQSPEYRQ